MSNIRHIVIVAPSNSTLLDVAGPLDVFAKSMEYYDLAKGRVDFVYQTHVVSVKKSKSIPMSSGIYIVGESNYKSINYDIDTLIVAGLPKLSDFVMDKVFLDWLAVKAKNTRRICSVCSGAFFLAEAGVLNGRKATTHWMLCKQLIENYPKIQVDMDPIFVKDGNVYTSAGITAGMDLALALVEEDFGKSFALEIAKLMVLFLKRPGNQSQYSTVLKSQSIDHKPIESVVNWMLENLNNDLSVEVLAEKAMMSSRNFSRVFSRELKISPARYVEKIRLEAACRLFENTKLTIDEVAVQCGLKNSENLRRLFVKTYDILPSQYRECF